MMKLYADVVLIKLQILTLSGIIVTTVLDYDGIASALFTMTFFLTLGIWAVEAQKRISRVSLLALMIAMLSCMCVLLNALITSTILSFSYLKKMIMFWSTVIFLAAIRDYRPEKSIVDLIFRMNTALALFFIAAYYVFGEAMYLYYGRLSSYLIFNFTNPNLTAIFLSAVVIIELICAYACIKKTAKAFHWVLAGFMIYFILLTQARNALLLIVLFVAVYLVMLLYPKNWFRMTGWLATLIAVLPFLFAVVYMAIVYVPWVEKMFAFIVGEGKGLDSRVMMWTGAFESIAASPVIGAYSQISRGGGVSQMHNSHLDVAASYGVLVLVILCFFLYQMLYDKYKGNQNRMNFVCMMGFAALLMSGIGEAVIFSGGMGIYIFMGTIRMLANYDWENINKTK